MFSLLQNVWILTYQAALVALITLILFFVFPAYFITPAFVLPTLYANTILAVLNSRFQFLDDRGYISTTNMMSAPSSVQSPIISIERETFATRELDDLGKTDA